MDILKIVLMILFAIDCIALTAIVLMQEGKSAGLGAISGIADTIGSEQRSFNGRSTCKVYKVPCDSVCCTGSSVEFESICLREEEKHSCIGVLFLTVEER